MLTEKFNTLNKTDVENLIWEVENRNLNIGGTIPSYTVKNKIDSILSTIHEIEKVNNNLGIILPIVAQKEISEKVKNILSKSNYAENKNLNFAIDKDEVTLSGEVLTIEEKLKLGFEISQIAGIRILINNLEVLENLNLSESEAINNLNKTVINFEVNQTSLTKNHTKLLEPIILFLRKIKIIKLK